MDLVSVIAFGGASSVVALLAFICYKYGRVSILKEQAQQNAEVRERQIDAVVNSVPAVDSLHKHEF